MLAHAVRAVRHLYSVHRGVYFTLQIGYRCRLCRIDILGRKSRGERNRRDRSSRSWAGSRHCPPPHNYARNVIIRRPILFLDTTSTNNSSAGPLVSLGVSEIRPQPRSPCWPLPNVRTPPLLRLGLRRCRYRNHHCQ